MNIIFLGGFLGSGKTSLLMSIAKYLTNNDHGNNKNTLAIIENEIGEISIDTQSVNTGGYSVKTMFAGCICCTLSTDLAISVNEIAKNEDPAWMIVETTGLAYPDKAADIVKQYCSSCYDRMQTITIIDAERWEELSEILEPLMLGQVRSADTMIVNKIDLAEQGDLEKLSDQLHALNDTAPVYFLSAKRGIEDERWDEILDGKGALRNG